MLQWPTPESTTSRRDPGISWTELSISFMLWSNRFLPVRIKEAGTNIPVDYNDVRIQLQPVKNRSLRTLSETFRLIIKHIQTFAKIAIIPTYPPTPAYSQSLGGEAPGTPQGEAVGQA